MEINVPEQFRADVNKIHQCWECDSQGEFYEYVSEDNIVDVPDDDYTIN